MAFAPSVLLDSALTTKIRAGQLSLHTGQWVHDHDGRRGQVIEASPRALAVSWVRQGESFEDRTQRFARAIWHRTHKHDAVTAVIHAPASIDIDRLKEHFRSTFAQAA